MDSSVASTATPYEIQHVFVPTHKRNRGSVDKTTTVSSASILSTSTMGSYEYWVRKHSARICRWIPTFILSVAALGFMAAAVVFFVQAARDARRRRTSLSYDEVASHKYPTDCWVVIYGQVFDLTKFKHPGGTEYILEHCGEDATDTYRGFHTTALLKSVRSRFVGIIKVDNTTASIRAPISSTEQKPSETLFPSARQPTKHEVSTTTVQLFNSTQVARHSNADTDCWIVYHGSVYNMTDFAILHPGGPANITDHCGTDSTTSFAVFHSVEKLALVKSYLVGFYEDDASASTHTEGPRATPTLSTTTIPPSTHPVSSTTPTPSPFEVQIETASPTFRSTVTIDTSTPASVPSSKSASPPVNAPEPFAPADFDLDSSMLKIPLVNSSQLEAHSDTENDCWVQYFGSVYNMTAYSDHHPGGRANITSFCGTDATAAFAEIHTLGDLGLIQDYLVGFSDGSNGEL